MTELELLVDFHKSAKRQGPGSLNTTLKAMDLVNLSRDKNLKVADIGCGTGFQTLVLAENSSWEITAIDFLKEFIEILEKKLIENKLQDRVKLKTESMDNLSFEKESLDLIWSEGAIYNMGFENGLKYWKQFLKKEAYIAVSEITWLTEERPKELNDYWKSNYEEIGTFSEKKEVIERLGYSLVDYFILPQDDWLESYYNPMEMRFNEFLERHNHSLEAKKLVENDEKEIEIYKKYKEYFSYGFYVMKKISRRNV